MSTLLAKYNSVLEAAFNAGTLPSVDIFTRFVNGEGVLAQVPESKPLVVPILYPIVVPLNVNVDDVKKNFPMTKECRENLTNVNYKTSPPTGPIQGGFYSIGDHYSIDKALARVSKLVSQTGRRFRIGTALEAMLYKSQGNPHPDYFVSLEKVKIEQCLLCHLIWYGGAEFDFTSSQDTWSLVYKVFVVEDL